MRIKNKTLPSCFSMFNNSRGMVNLLSSRNIIKIVADDDTNDTFISRLSREIWKIFEHSRITLETQSRNASL